MTNLRRAIIVTGCANCPYAKFKYDVEVDDLKDKDAAKHITRLICIHPSWNEHLHLVTFPLYYIVADCGGDTIITTPDDCPLPILKGSI